MNKNIIPKVSIFMRKFNPLRYTKRLKEAGMPEKQAEIMAEEFLEIMENDLATKDDFKNVKEELKNVEKRLDNKIDTVQAVLSTKIGIVDTKLNWLMTLLGVIGLLLAVINFLHPH